MSRGGKREGAGRPKASRNRRTKELVAKVEATGLPPMEITLATARALFARAFNDKGEMVDQEAAVLASQEAARTFSFLYPKLASVELSGGLAITHEQALQQLK